MNFFFSGEKFIAKMILAELFQRSFGNYSQITTPKNPRREEVREIHVALHKSSTKTIPTKFFYNAICEPRLHENLVSVKGCFQIIAIQNLYQINNKISFISIVNRRIGVFNCMLIKAQYKNTSKLESSTKSPL